MGPQQQTLTPSPVDVVVTDLIDRIHKQNKGFVLGLAQEGGNLDVTVQQKLPERDLYQGPPDYRAHVLTDTDSFVAYAHKYGTAEKSVVIVGTEGATLTLEEQPEKGGRETMTLTLPKAEDFIEWSEAVGAALDHRQLLTFLMEHEDNLLDPKVLLAMQSVKATSTVNYESDIRDDGKTLGVVFKSQAGDELKSFPKAFDVVLPVLEADEADKGQWAKVNVKLTIDMPTTPQGKPTFTLFCPELRTVHKQRIRAEANLLRDALDGWLVIEGTYGTKPHELRR